MALAENHLHAGRYKESESLIRQSWEIRRENLGFKHPSSIDSMIKVARILQLKGDTKEAFRLLSQVLEIEKERDPKSLR